MAGTSSTMRPAPVLILLMLTALALVAALATPASAIDDPDTPPAATWVVDFAGGYDSAADVAVNSGGAAYVCGEATNAAGSLDGSLCKVPPSGAGWRKTWDGPAGRTDLFYAVAVGRDGAVYTAGASRNAANQLDMRLVKWSSTGAVLWTRRYTGPVAGDDLAYDVVVDRNGNVTICGESQGREGTAFTVVSWNADGKRRWLRRIEGVALSDDRASAMVVDGSGNVYVTGKRSWELGMAGYTVKLTPSGATKWSFTYKGGDDIDLAAIAKRRGGGVFVCGWQLGFDTGWDGIILRLTAAGARQLFSIDMGDGADSTDTYFQSIATTPTGKLAVAGSVYLDYGASIHRYYRVYDVATGLPEVSATYPCTDPERLAVVAADAYGGLYVTGTRALTASHDIFWTHRHSTIPDGGTWTGQFGAGWVGPNTPTAIATWRTTVWVVGRGFPGGTSGDQLILKYVY